MASARLPDFLGIGAVKASTTWLYRNLYRHPGIYLPVTKPVRYFDWHIDKPIDTYKAIFKPGVDRLCGEFSASYSVLPPATIAYIREIMPAAKLVFLMREPKSRAWSEARMEFSVVKGLGDKEITDDEYCDFIESEKCRTRGDYYTILNNWMAAFPKSQIFIGLIDDVQERPRDVLKQVLDFLELPADFDGFGEQAEQKVFEGLPRPMPERCRRLLDDLYQPDEIRRLGDFVGMDLVGRWGYA